ncbi:hypothetical protein FUAX_19450 [Fulvitalea axinellae]|uniref:Lipoprotein n=1 Tax=Fulvitalea axinellae TaxID=1182444 RepID=A0AAU9CN94_9BACT|nr:hypothetical protein FUAX_19450 [Fulvitalea axinellae]
MKVICYLFFSVVLSGCVAGKINTPIECCLIQLKGEEGKVKFFIDTPNAKIVIDGNEIQSDSSVQDCFGKEAFELVDNLQLKSLCDEKVFNLVWRDLRNGKVRVYDKKNDGFVKTIEFVNVKDVMGEQEYFRFVGGELILSKVISLGE